MGNATVETAPDPNRTIAARQTRELLAREPEVVLSVVMQHLRARQRRYDTRCEHCDAPIEGATAMQRFCGDACRKRAARDSERRWRRGGVVDTRSYEEWAEQCKRDSVSWAPKFDSLKW
jgi:hypothetical protein